jgi:type II secretory pathway component PulK
VALIFVLMIFAIIVVVATSIATRLYHNTEKHSRYLQFVQAKHYAFGGEQYAALLLGMLFRIMVQACGDTGCHDNNDSKYHQHKNQSHP